jgi:hypothetical protein
MIIFKRYAVAVCLLMFSFAGTAYAGNFTSCFGTNAGNYFRTQTTDGNVDSRMRNYNDYGMFFHDALNGCNLSTVATRLEQKIRNTPDSEWTVTFAGSPISVIMATGLMLGAQGALTEGLDTAIRDVGNKYQFIKDPTCGISGGKYAGGNACLDDFTLAMTGYAWISAYKRLTGRAWEYERSQAVQQITNAFHPHEGTCIYNPDRALDIGTVTNRGFCNGYNSDLGTNPKAEILSINHGNQTPAYGIGLMTSVAAAFAGLDTAQKPIISMDWNSSQRLLMEWILVEGRRRSKADGNFESADAGDRSCFDIVNGSLVKGILCGDDGFPNMTEANWVVTHYRANMNPVVPFYTRYGLRTNIDSTGFSYGAGTFAETFADATNSNYLDAWFGPFRRAVYKVMAGDWVYAYPNGRPRLTGRAEYKMTLGHFPSYYTMANGGGSTIDTTSTSTSDTRVRLILKDLSPLTPLQNGDAVSIRTPSGYYLTAVNGGGSAVNATSTTFNTVTNTFYVNKSNSAAGPIAAGDNINLKTYYGYYVISTANSSSPPTAYSTTPGIGSPDFVKLEF